MCLPNLVLFLTLLGFCLGQIESQELNDKINKIQTVIKILANYDYHFSGTWRKIQEEPNTKTQMPIMKEKEGKLLAKFLYTEDSPDTFGASFSLFDGMYEEFSNFNFTLLDLAINSTDSWQEDRYNTSIREAEIEFYNQYIFPLYYKNNVSLEFDFTNVLQNNEKGIVYATDLGNITITLKVYSDFEFCQEGDCSVVVEYTGSVMATESGKPTWTYYISVVAISLVKVYFTIRLIWSMTDPNVPGDKLSSMTAGLIFLWNLSLVTGYLRPSLLKYESLAQVPILFIFWLGILCSDLTLWEIVAKRDGSMSRYGFCGGLCISLLTGVVLLIIVYLFVIFDFAKLLMSCCFVPQIIKNVLQSDLVAFPKYRELVGSCITFLFILYFRGVEDNVLGTYYSPKFCYQFIGIFFSQIIVLHLQHSKGPRFFIPERWHTRLPNRYGVLVEMTTDIEANCDAICSICLQNLNQNPESEPSLQTKAIADTLKQKEGKIFKTKCGHKFHIYCLIEWMTRKAECPVCRTQVEGLDI